MKLKAYLERHLLIYRLVVLVGNMICRLVPARIRVQRRYKKKFGSSLDLESPQTYNEKLQWMKLYWEDSRASVCADKYAVRKLVADTIGDKYLNTLFGVYDSPDQIDFDALPDSFVIKLTHGSGMNIVCKDKSRLDVVYARRLLAVWQAMDYACLKTELVYRNVPRRIICEKFIDTGGEELRDYRFFCFNGEPKFIAVDLSITDKSKTRRNIYDLEWNQMPVRITYPNENEVSIPRPSKLEEMVELSRRLSAGFPHVRIDFYCEDTVLFGEMTFFHQSGLGIMLPKEFNLQVGSYLELPA
ncbi:MAG: glycosyl transferase [Spirochaetaceae bacterium]|nr:MAG: glycosyl transferase [Spirochaetaceae bacterium]